MRKGSLLIIALWLAVSCAEIKDCTLDTSTDYAVAIFYRYDTTAQVEKEVAFNYIAEITAGQYYITTASDTIDDDTITAVPIFLYSESDHVTYRFATDTVDFLLEVSYTPHLRIYYEDCEPVYSYRLDSVYSDQFDSVVISSKVVDKYVTSNIEIYL